MGPYESDEDRDWSCGDDFHDEDVRMEQDNTYAANAWIAHEDFS